MIPDYIKSKGWVKFGRCGCSPPMDKYSSDEFKGFEIRVGMKGNTMVIRKNGVEQARAGIVNYEEVYTTYFS